MVNALGLQGPRHTHFKHADADGCCELLINPHVLQRLHHVEIGFARSHNPQPGIRAVYHHMVQSIDARKFPRCINLELVESSLLLQRLIGPARMDALSGQLKILGDQNADAGRIDIR